VSDVGARGYFIAGTDTGAGKTRVTCALLRGLNLAGRCAAGMKPIATGAKLVNGRLFSDDVAQITANSAHIGPESCVNPYLFDLPVSPDIAAELAGISIDPVAIRTNFAVLASQVELVLVEGTGGWLCPIGPRQTMADVAALLGVPVLLVVGLKLGCISHALLSAESIRGRGCTFGGWIGNRVDPDYRLPDANVATLTRLLGLPPLALLEYAPQESALPGSDLLALAHRL
jgi:dethiobiotin synthetase